MWCRLYTSKLTSEGQTLAKESTIYFVQLSVGERNFILRGNVGELANKNNEEKNPTRIAKRL